jgi:hypothetical protein
MTSDELRRMSLEELEELYVGDQETQIPAGVFKGKVLRWFPVPPGEHVLMRPLLWLWFGVTPFGVDFDKDRWFFFFDQSPRIGHFTPRIGPSRWYPSAETIQLHYQISRLPEGFKANLYDEVRPLTDTTCLGVGGINTHEGAKREFFFVLERFGG